MSDFPERPLVTFALFAYNQERFIREAVEGALTQDYSPLEVILSDDCSTDRTFDLMSELASNYHGPHHIRLNKNSENLGIGGHVNKILDLAQGKWVVMAAGDDISLPSRVKRTMHRAQDLSCPVDCIAVQLKVINDDGKETGEIRNAYSDRARVGALELIGAGLAYSERVKTCFEPMSNQINNEDIILVARSLLLSAVGIIPEQLVHYRTHEGNRLYHNRSFKSFDSKWVSFKLKSARQRLIVVSQIEKDCKNMDATRIPDYKRIVQSGKKARYIKMAIEIGFFSSLPNMLPNIYHKDIIKFILGLLVVRISNIFNRH